MSFNYKRFQKNLNLIKDNFLNENILNKINNKIFKNKNMNFEISLIEMILSAIILIFNVICYLKIEIISKYIQLYDYPDGIRKLHKNKTSLLVEFISFYQY